MLQRYDIQHPVCFVRLIGIEPTPQAPEAGALSTELQTHLHYSTILFFNLQGLFTAFIEDLLLFFLYFVRIKQNYGGGEQGTGGGPDGKKQKKAGKEPDDRQAASALPVYFDDSLCDSSGGSSSADA